MPRLGDMQTELNALSKEGKWVEMGNLVDDEILDTFAVVGEPEQIAEGLKSRFGDIVQRLSFMPHIVQMPNGGAKCLLI